MKRPVRSFTVLACSILASLALVSAAAAQNAFPRVTGLSVSNVARDGYDVTFDVTMTTTQSTATLSPWHPGRLGDNTGFYSTVASTPGVITLGSGFAGLTTVYNLVHLIPPGVADFNTIEFHRAYVPTTSALYSFSLLITTSSYWRGPVPAIDFGDGNTVPVTTLTSASTTSTVGGATTRVFRGSFSHTYADHGDCTIRVGSPPNTDPLASVAYGSALTRDVYPLQRTYGTGFHWLLTTAVSDQHSTLYVNILLGTTTLVPSTTDVVSTITGGNRLLFSPYATVGAAAQVTASAAAAFSVLEVPAASTYGLLALTVLLAAAGVMLLRR